MWNQHGFLLFQTEAAQAVPVGGSSCELFFVIETVSAQKITNGQLYQQGRLYRLGWTVSLTLTLSKFLWGYRVHGRQRVRTRRLQAAARYHFGSSGDTGYERAPLR